MEILATLAKYTGKKVLWGFLSQTQDFIPDIERFHHRISGIYKPAWSEIALSIVMMPGSPYEKKDDVVFLDDVRWLITYSPRSGRLDISDNCALARCNADGSMFLRFTSALLRECCLGGGGDK